MAFSTGRQRGAPMAEINVTPLVDVMLVLLIIFMVTAPMLQEGITVDLPAASGAPLQENPNQKDIIISVDNKGAIYIDDVEVQEKELVARTLPRLKKTPDTVSICVQTPVSHTESWCVSWQLFGAPV